MAEFLTISNAPLEYPGMDYALLRQEGIDSIQQLTGNLWTDYNTHDPGITILEILCYAITDLSYRLSFEMKDLLAYPVGQSTNRSRFFTAREILTVNPLTINDYRKLLIDIDGIKNAWLEPLDKPQPELYYDNNHATLSFVTTELTEPVHLNGLYRVLLEKEPDYQDSQLILAATARLNQHRNLCEDFAEIKVLPIEEITVQAEIEVENGFNPNHLMAQIYARLDRCISPAIAFLNLNQLLDQGKASEEIFEGPALDHGFIETEQLQQFDRKTQIHTSDLIHVILDIAGVKAIRTISLASDRSPNPETWSLDLDPDLTPRLKHIKTILRDRDFTFYNGQFIYPIDAVSVEQTLTTISPSQQSSAEAGEKHDIVPPRGEYRDLAAYESIQNDFPLTYGIGEIGLPASASAESKARSKQLQAYLMVFDQLLANYFAQLDHVKELLSLGNGQIKTYFSQSIAHFPGGEAIFNDNYEAQLENLQEEGAIALERKNRLLNYLIAQHGEQFTADSLLVSNSSLLESVIHNKVAFSTDYIQISSGRNQAFNYTVDPYQSDNNVAGLKCRIARLLGISPTRQFLASSNEEGFYLIEHILLRPHSSNASHLISDFLSFSTSITEFKSSELEGQVTCTSPQHGLREGDSINIFYSSLYSGTYTVSNVQFDSFDITHEFLAEDTGEWVKSDQSPDPFSFQISFVFPDWPVRLQNPNFKQLVYDTLMAETPAHITIYCHWLNEIQMREFETTYTIWLQALARDSTSTIALQESANRLINFLKLGSSQIPDLPALIGYMTIGDSFIVT